MKITKRKVGELVEDENNAREHDTRNLQAIEKSLQEFGQQKPIVITRDNKVIAGNGTLIAATSLGWDEIDVVVTTLDEVKQTGFAIADNRTAELAAWDDDALAKTLLDLTDKGFDMDSIGFTEKEIATLILEVMPEAIDFPNLPERGERSVLFSISHEDGDIFDRVLAKVIGANQGCKIMNILKEWEGRQKLGGAAS
tara:strand:+ start:88 stop:678 length:591 start_codon:yes stop_codon:yes gene_type:complete